MTDEWWDLVIDVNLTGTFNCIRSIAPYTRDLAKKEIEASGRPACTRKIVNFYSTAAIRGNPGQINYTAAKMGNVGITRTIAQEWGRFGITCNAVAPGFTNTRLTKAKQPGDELGVPEAQRQEMIARIPLGRIGEPEDIANAVLFFSSSLSDFITGQELNVSGGMQIP
jgi:3-oxoacyl-[acyl-carrier protein] reductase